jgi:peptide/nickel transport system ATP-binding protein
MTAAGGASARRADALIDLDGLSVRYRRAAAPALDDVSLRIEPGEVVAVVGESGSGKSTLAARLLGLLGPEAEVDQRGYRLEGRDVSALGDRAWSRLRGRRVGFVPQDPAGSLDPVQTIADQLAEALRLAGVPRQRRRARSLELLAEAGVEQPERLLVRYPHQLSGGLCQRVLIAIAIAGDPALLVADEPTSALDVTTQQHVLDRLGAIVRATGTALLLITHDLGVASDRADRVVVLRGGRLVEQGPAAAVLRSPVEDYTRELVRAAPRIDRAAQRAAVPADRDAVLEASGLRKVFRGGTVAVRDASLAVPRSTTTSIVGQSGSGKSTLARLLLGLERADAGEVRIRPADADELSPDGLDRRGVRRLSRVAQMVYQNPFASLPPGFEVGAIVAEPLRAHRSGDRASRRRAVSELLDAVGLPAEAAGRRPGELSGGQRQRVAIARALALRPELLVLDEPVSALDVRVQEQILRLLVELQAELGLSYVLISHDLAVVRQVSDAVIVMRRGEFVEAGPSEALFADPRHEYTRELIAASPGRR